MIAVDNSYSSTSGKRKRCELTDQIARTFEKRQKRSALLEIPISHVNCIFEIDHKKDRAESSYCFAAQTPLKSILKTSQSKMNLFKLKLKKFNKQKSVKFASNAKHWDGMNQDNGHSDFDDLLYRYLCFRQRIGDTKVLEWTKNEPERVNAVYTLLKKLCARLDKLDHDHETIPCLPQGGGKALKVQKSDLPELGNLEKVLETVALIAQRKVHEKPDGII